MQAICRFLHKSLGAHCNALRLDFTVKIWYNSTHAACLHSRLRRSVRRNSPFRRRKQPSHPRRGRDQDRNARRSRRGLVLGRGANAVQHNPSGRAQRHLQLRRHSEDHRRGSSYRGLFAEEKKNTASEKRTHNCNKAVRGAVAAACRPFLCANLLVKENVAAPNADGRHGPRLPARPAFHAPPFAT